ncbi:50S ribosomal protein L4 [bacterium]|jgi:large subunit ribosomal protein L4|nr:50S ribosomal protein L4 [bacterium]
MKIKTLTLSGEETGSKSAGITVPKVQDNADHWIYLAVKYQQASRHQGTHNTLSRGEVRGGGAKPYKQKGTGNARRGTNRTPLRVGGSVIFGPKPRSHAIDINPDVLKKAIKVVLGQKGDGLFVLDYKDEAELKTKQVQQLLDSIQKDTSKKVMFVLGVENECLQKACRNIKRGLISSPLSIEVADLLDVDQVIFSSAALEKARETLS